MVAQRFAVPASARALLSSRSSTRVSNTNTNIYSSNNLQQPQQQKQHLRLRHRVYSTAATHCSREGHRLLAAQNTSRCRNNNSNSSSRSSRATVVANSSSNHSDTSSDGSPRKTRVAGFVSGGGSNMRALYNAMQDGTLPAEVLQQSQSHLEPGKHRTEQMQQWLVLMILLLLLLERCAVLVLLVLMF